MILFFWIKYIYFRRTAFIWNRNLP